MADTTYCTGRLSQLEWKNITKHCDRVDLTLCRVKMIKSKSKSKRHPWLQSMHGALTTLSRLVFTEAAFLHSFAVVFSFVRPIDVPRPHECDYPTERERSFAPPFLFADEAEPFVSCRQMARDSTPPQKRDRDQKAHALGRSGLRTGVSGPHESK